MKTQLPAMVLFLFVPCHWRTPLVSAALCLRPQKTSLHWLAPLYLTPNISRLTALFLPANPFPARLAHLTCLFKLQGASNPAYFNTELCGGFLFRHSPLRTTRHTNS